MAAYNRGHTLQRAVSSVLAQTFQDWELLIIDDGSTDNTQQVLLSYLTEPRIKIIKNTKNCGVAVSRNRGLDLMKGHWFTLLDSDDEMVSSALAELLEVPKRVDPNIDAVTCNCVNSVTGEFTGQGLMHDQLLPFETLVTACRGEHWGLTKSSLLGNLRFNEYLSWGESVLWYKISKNACRYYLHKGLRIYHTEGEDRLCGKKRVVNLNNKCVYYRELAKETEYLELMKRYRPQEYATMLLRIATVHILENRRKEARQVVLEGYQLWSNKHRIIVTASLLLGPKVLRGIIPIFLKFN